jgi:hypothetical protein
MTTEHRDEVTGEVRTAQEMRNLRLVQWGDRIISEECYTELTTRPRKRRIDWGNVVAWALALILMAWVLWSTT